MRVFFFSNPSNKNLFWYLAKSERHSIHLNICKMYKLKRFNLINTYADTFLMIGTNILIIWSRMLSSECLSFKMDRKSHENSYLVFIRPLLEYGDILWDNCTAYEKWTIEEPNWSSENHNWCNKTCFFKQSLQRRWLEDSAQTRTHKIIELPFYKIRNQLAPAYLSPLILQQVNTISRHDLHNPNDIILSGLTLVSIITFFYHRL